MTRYQDTGEWVADFETTTDPTDCRVWAWGLGNIENIRTARDVEMGNSIEGFFDRVSSMKAAKVYFHNLKFDGAFIMDALMAGGFEHTTGTPGKGEFSTLISYMGAHYSIKVVWRNGKKTEFRDSLKKLPMKVSRIATSFKLPELKGELDYHTPRPVGHVLTREEKAYLASDVLIVARALKIQFEQGMTKLTVGADSLAEYKRLESTKLFKRRFPVLNPRLDAEIRAAYRGGFTYADVRYQGRVLGAGITYDVNSLYPSVMYDRVLPYGMPEMFDGAPRDDPRYPLYIVSITFTARLKKNHIPCIQVKNTAHFAATEYQQHISEPVTLSCTNVDLALWMDHYDMEILSWNGGWKFTADTGFFTEYIDKWMDVKATSEGGMREIAKLHLNSLYGKFATNPDVTGKIPVYEDEQIRLVEGEPETRDPVYTAMGVFITSYARDVTIRAAQENYAHFAYADTDSLHLLVPEDPPMLEVDPHKLGTWKREYKFVSAFFARAKQYSQVLEDGSRVTHIAAMPDYLAEQVTYDHFINGHTFGGKLIARRVPGGMVLSETEFTLKP